MVSGMTVTYHMHSTSIFKQWIRVSGLVLLQNLQRITRRVIVSITDSKCVRKSGSTEFSTVLGSSGIYIHSNIDIKTCGTVVGINLHERAEDCRSISFFLLCWTTQTLPHATDCRVLLRTAGISWQKGKLFVTKGYHTIRIENCEENTPGIVTLQVLFLPSEKSVFKTQHSVTKNFATSNAFHCICSNRTLWVYPAKKTCIKNKLGSLKQISPPRP
jgi:hypothetical protein